jgi:ligand-binding sensor domain-containing protein
MKTYLLKLVLLFITLSPFLTAQEEYPLLKLLESEKDNPKPRQTPKSYRNKKDQRVKLNYSVFNDCSQVTRADYCLCKDYSSNYVELPEGQTYTGTKNGILMWDNYTDIWITTENSNIPENNITALALDHDDQLWIGTKDSGIVIGTGDVVKPWRIQSVRTRDQHIVSISADVHGYVWVVYANGGIECFLNGISCTYFPN